MISFNKILLATLLSLFLILANDTQTHAQSAEVIGGNMLNGAVTGTILGAATMGLQDNTDFAPLRIGLGAGIIAGTGIAIYDIGTLPKGQQMYISGLFNDGTNSSILILLDTVYGAAVGAALGSAFMLVTNEPLVEGLQYGSSLGAWSGFAVGLFDSFFFAERNRDFISSKWTDNGLFSYQNKRISLSLIEPTLHNEVQFHDGKLGLNTSPAIQVISFRTSF
ncbi:MAG: hypothetical protein GVY08_09305 [Bacteroidetes bacterium]|jgi:hypothetical protein|nr:hypothetical protein [Bacteroidota bacterium]